MLIETLSGDYRIARSTDSTDASFPSRINTITEPTQDGVYDLSTGLPLVQNLALILPYGVGSDNDTFSVRVIGWRKVGTARPGGQVPAGNTRLWIPLVLAEYACTLSADVGVAGAIIDNTHRFADTMTLTTGNANVSEELVSPGGDLKAHAVLDLKGVHKLEFTFQITSGTTAMNCLFALY